jgi:hypothetical protein
MTTKVTLNDIVAQNQNLVALLGIAGILNSALCGKIVLFPPNEALGCQDLSSKRDYLCR